MEVKIINTIKLIKQQVKNFKVPIVTEVSQKKSPYDMVKLSSQRLEKLILEKLQ